MFYSPELGYWVVTRYEDVKSVFRDPLLFSPSNALEKVTPAPPEAQEILKKYGFDLQRTMVNEDEPQHMERRRLLLDAFLPENLIKHEPSVRNLARQYMDRFLDKGRADLVAEMFYEIPLTVALHFLGVPDDGAEELKQFAVAHTLNTWGRPTREEQLAISENVGRFWKTANDILDRMRADPTGEGWMYDTIRAHMDHPEAVPESYLRSMMMAILAAAHETTSNATSNMFWTLLSDRTAWDEVCENPALIPSAVEECLRVAGSIVAWRRIATDDTEVGGVKIPKGGKLMIVQASANKDGRYWENPDDIDIYRDNAADHLTFGYGAHQCMGKNIARMEMRVFLDEFVRRLPHIRLADGQTFRNLPNMSFRGPESLVVEWDPALNPEKTDPAIKERGTSFKIGAPAKDDILRQVVVAETEMTADGVLRVALADPRGRSLPSWTPGAHIDLVSGDIRRKYSLCGSPQDTRTWQVAILREDAGRGGSVHFHETLQAGDVVQVAGPKNHFKLDETAAGYVLVAGGIGITPMITMADRLKHDGKRYRLYYCGSSRGRMGLLERAIADHGEALSVHIGDEGSRIDLAAVLSGLRVGDQVYSCGPERMLDALDAMSQTWPEGTLHIEHFSTGSSILDPEKELPFQVELSDSGLTVEVARDQTLLDALTSAGIDVPCDCNEGLCGTCEVAVLEGDIDHRDRVLTSTERKANTRMMACCSRTKAGKLRLAL
ncbi:cytochrome P450/oxidoreductase [Microbaculum marinisediminis]|uniref:Cytochrome P450/oxidoreductase n=1 Tax=Microbaculum marinisediminis TaxID=2931392 RepID=A0AAW5R7M8_9HYPH|nr:cytochrome P450/oxidoreductase [Microbaculum sp. A6E488]MCT8974644.1 cytochrome P450/oxidoreductase [Microbaculum sp. A6E488]